MQDLFKEGDLSVLHVFFGRKFKKILVIWQIYTEAQHEGNEAVRFFELMWKKCWIKDLHLKKHSLFSMIL